MILTRAELQNYMKNPFWGRTEVIDGILKNQEKDEKWDKLENAKTHEALVDYPRLLKLEERLKKRIKELTDPHLDRGRFMDWELEQLQKILEAEK